MRTLPTATFDAYISSSAGKPVFYYTARNEKYYVQAMFLPSLFDDGSATISVSKVSNPIFSIGDFVLVPTQLTRDQISLILSFETPEQFIQYALSLSNQASVPNEPLFITFNGGCSDPACETLGAFNDRCIVLIYFTQNDYEVPVDIFVKNERILRINDLTKDQIDSILSIKNPQTLIYYILTLKNNESTPCPAPVVPSDDGDGASFIDDDLPPAYTQSQVGGVQ